MIPSVIYDYDPRNLPREILEAIGMVATASAQTEHVVETGIGGCLGLGPDYSAAVTTHMAAPMRDNVIRAAAEIRIDDLDALDRLDDLLDEVDKAFKKRNAYVHRSWCRHPKTGQVYTLKTEARGSVDTDLIPMSVTQIKEDAAFIYKVGMDLWTFLMDHNLITPVTSIPRPRAHKTKAARKKRRKALLSGEC